MKPTTQNIKHLVDNRRVLRGVNPFELKIETIDRICETCLDEVQRSIVDKTEPFWTETWKSMRVLKESVKNKINPIPRLDTLIETISENLNRSFPIKVCTTRNIGPEYVYFDSSSDKRDKLDWVRVPEIYRFTNNKFYYKTFFHEFGHAACSRHRLCLKFNIRDEEEVAVDTSAMILCFLNGINVWDDSIAYSQNQAYGSRSMGEDHILYIKTSRQWLGIRNKIKRIVKYLLSGKGNPTSLII